MIIKSLSRKSPFYGSLMQYVKKEGKGKAGKVPHVFTFNLQSFTLAGWIREFQINEALRLHPRKDNAFMHHVIISMGKDDKEVITWDMMKSIVERYFELRPSALGIAAIHEDRDHWHAHAVLSGCEAMTGKALRLSKSKLQQVKLDMERFIKEQFPQLTHSHCNHGQGKDYLTNREYYAMANNKKALLKETIRGQIEHCLSQATSQQHFLSLLRDRYGLHHYERNKDGKATGILTPEGMKFRFSTLVETDKIDQLPVDRSEEEQMLQEIQVLRQEANDRSRELFELDR